MHPVVSSSSPSVAWTKFSRLVAIALASVGLLVSTSAAAQMRIAVVDTQRAVMETEDGLRAQATLKKLFERRQKELDQKQKDLQKERGELEKQRGKLAGEAMAKRIETWQKEMAQVQNTFMQYNQELQKKQNELTAPIVQKTVGIIRRVATQAGYDMVIEKQTATYFRSDLDLTDRVITVYNRGGQLSPKKK